ncbi:hypothetical protein PoB_000375900 [Plakobranchus ocellatus]|uniref:Reverse transcriptase domain-containing protein n=1 Tax=Plakobranchus ocellatus TaxID=259542 RepID=A0AAV3Y4W1_9GAST|nr:hypothetical protein PoB_000375900 [Plakobranchus ocellatus]
MTDGALENHEGKSALEAEQLRFADDIDGLARKEEELESLVDSLDNTVTAYGMEISAEKIKLITYNSNGISADIRIGGQNLKQSTSSSIFEHLSQMKDQNQKYCPESHKQQQH